MAVHILVVDDEEDIWDLLKGKFRRRLRDEEWVLHMASNGVEALEILDREPAITLVLTDINMPEMDGLTLLDHIRAKDRLLQAIVVSAYGDMQNIRLAMNRGAFDFVVKPINMADLEVTMLKTLEHIALLEEARRNQEALALSREMERFRSQFFANVSHEFRTPLTLILGPVQDMLHGMAGELSPVAKKRLAMVKEHAGRLKHLIDQLLDIARLEAGHATLNLCRQDVCAFIDKQYLAFQPAAEKADISLAIQHTAENLSAWFDPGHFEKIIANLVSNALKWTPAGGRIRILTGAKTQADMISPAKMIYVEVRDNGAGIPADALPHIFDRFYQVEGAAGTHIGTGIGLALTKELVELHSGTIEVASEPGFGSTFTVCFPVGNADDVADIQAVSEEASSVGVVSDLPAMFFEDEDFEETGETASLNGARVLVVEDHPDMRAYICDLLAPLYHVIPAENGREALQLLKTEFDEAAPALIISDVMMPDMDGFQLCKTIKQNPKFQHIPLILLTARAEDEDRLEGLGLGADDYIVKPFNASELLIRAENLIAIRDMLKQKYASGYVMQVSEVSIQSADEAFLASVQEVIEAQMGNPDLEVPQLADALAMSPRQLRRKIRALTGLSTAGLVRSMRLQRAAQLLTQKAGSISEIAYQVGFQQPKYFSRQFKQVYGVTPSEYC